MEHHTNRRGKAENFIRSEHVDLNDLDERARASGLQNRYLGIPTIPNYPKPEFQLSLLKHDTERTGLSHIWKYGGFKDPFKGCYDPDKLPLVWWNLAVTSEEIQSAEKRLLNKTFPNRTEEQAMRQKKKRFLKKFASSPAFSEKSRYGSYRFTFTVQEVLDAYSKQFCSGDPPILRVFKTSLYKKEVMYAVLVHRPENDDKENEIFEHYQPLPTDPNAICAYREGCFFWNAKAMCDAHRYELINDMEENLAKAVPVKTQYYVWDHVALALHVKNGEVLRFDPEDLKSSLSFCEPDTVTVTPKFGFDTYEYAQRHITALWPLGEASLGQRFEELHLEE